MTASIWKPGTALSTQGQVLTENIIATEGQTVFNLSDLSYSVGTGSLHVFVSGLHQRVGNDYIENSVSQFTLNEGVPEGTVVSAVIFSGVTSEIPVVDLAPSSVGSDVAVFTNASATAFVGKTIAQLIAAMFPTLSAFIKDDLFAALTAEEAREVLLAMQASTDCTLYGDANGLNFPDASLLGILLRADLTDNRNWTLPDKSGTLAVVTDIPTEAAAARPFQSVISYTGTGGISSAGATLNVTATTPAIDNTIPQITEGAAVLDVTITPSKAGAVIEVETEVYGMSSISLTAHIHLFMDSVANAVKSVAVATAAVNYETHMHLLYRYTAPDTTPITFKVRAGVNGGTNVVNSCAVAPLNFGGVIQSYIKATEIAYT